MSELRHIHSYQFAPGLALERFDDEAILFVAEQDVLLTVNRGAADLFEAAVAAFADRTFDRGAAAAWFADAFELTAAEVPGKLLPVLAFALRQGIVVKPPSF